MVFSFLLFCIILVWVCLSLVWLQFFVCFKKQNKKNYTHLFIFKHFFIQRNDSFTINNHACTDCLYFLTFFPLPNREQMRPPSAVSSCNIEHGHYYRKTDLYLFIFFVSFSFSYKTETKPSMVHWEDGQYLKKGTWHYVHVKGSFVCISVQVVGGGGEDMWILLDVRIWHSIAAHSVCRNDQTNHTDSHSYCWFQTPQKIKSDQCLFPGTVRVWFTRH